MQEDVAAGICISKWKPSTRPLNCKGSVLDRQNNWDTLSPGLLALPFLSELTASGVGFRTRSTAASEAVKP